MNQNTMQFQSLKRLPRGKIVMGDCMNNTKTLGTR